MSTKEKTQLNNRVAPEIAAAVATIKRELGYTKDDIAEIAFANLFNSRDEELIAKRNKIQKKIKEIGLQLSFNDVLGQPQELPMAA